MDFGKNQLVERRTGKNIARIRENNERLPYIDLRLTMKGATKATKEVEAMLKNRRHGHRGTGTNCPECRMALATNSKLMRTEEKKKYEFGEILSGDTLVMPKASIEGYRYRIGFVDHGSGWLGGCQNSVLWWTGRGWTYWTVSHVVCLWNGSCSCNTEDGLSDTAADRTMKWC